jgi:chromosome partitioning protein
MPKPRKMAVYNQKGGAGKSTTAANLAATLVDAPLTRRVLALDADRQGNLSGMLGVLPHRDVVPGTMSDVFEGRPLARCTVSVTPGLDLVVGDARLTDVEFNLQRARRRDELLARQLEDELDGYDYVIVDCPPSQGLVAINACVFADEIIVPMRLNDPNSVNGLADLLDFLDELERAGWRRPLTSVLRLDIDQRLDIYQTLNDVLESADLPLADVQVPHRTAVAKAIAAGRPVVWQHPRSEAAITFRRFAHQLDTQYVAAIH